MIFMMLQENRFYKSHRKYRNSQKECSNEIAFIFCRWRVLICLKTLWKQRVSERNAKLVWALPSVRWFEELKARFQDASKKHKPLFIEQSNPVQDCHLQKTFPLFLRSNKNICAFCAFRVKLIRANQCQFVFEIYPCFLWFLCDLNSCQFVFKEKEKDYEETDCSKTSIPAEK